MADLASPASNPLLASAELPLFDAIRPEQVEPGAASLLAELGSELDALEASCEASARGLLEPTERITDRLHRFWGTVGHLMGVQNSDALRAAHERAQPDVVRFGMRMAQSRPLFAALERLRAGAGYTRLDPAERRIVDALVRDARLAGVALGGAERERFNAIELELAQLSTQFSNHVLDATKAFAVTLREREAVQGLPQSALDLAAQAHRSATGEAASAEAGPWRITLDAPSFVPFMQHSPRRELREQLYRAHVTRASAGALDNGPILERILALRREKAMLLGYKSYAELSLASKMAPDVGAVQQLLEELRSSAYPAAERDLGELRELAASRAAPEAADLRPWDVAYWAERLREARFAYSEEELRPYFPMPRVLAGLFALAERLFAVRIAPADGEAPTWHPDVRFFRVHDLRGQRLAAFYLDPYSRPQTKRGGAWMDDCVGRSRLLAAPGNAVRLPIAYLVCNGTPPVGGAPSLLSFSEVETLFHEFGHGLQHMLTRVDHGLASGIRNIEWDAVELPSQFMENWCYHRETLMGLSQHVQTGEPLPESLFAKLQAARTYRAGSDMLRQLYFAWLDLALHHEYQPGSREKALDVQRRIAERTTVLPPLAEDRFLCSFSHIFAGGYAAGYYSYKWAEVLSADAFAAFEESGLEDPRAVAATGARFRDTVLALGGSRAPMDVFVDFRGRPPRTDALLRHSGLAGGAQPAS